jgi:DNA-binding PadR family transcriptional regulator
MALAKTHTGRVVQPARWRRLIHEAVGELTPAYVVGIQNWLSSRVGWKPGLATVHRHLQWLEKHDFLTSHEGEPRPMAGGKRRREYQRTKKELPTTES